MSEPFQMIDTKRGIIITIDDESSQWEYSLVEDEMGQTHRLDHPNGTMMLCSFETLCHVAPTLGIEILEEKNRE